MNKILSRYDELHTVSVIFSIMCMLGASNITSAADDDIYIPYTETYGYTYDPASGQFIKNGGLEDSVNASVGGDIPVVDSGSSMATGTSDTGHVLATRNGNGSKSGDAAEGGFAIYYIFGGAIVACIMIFCWIRRSLKINGQNT